MPVVAPEREASLENIQITARGQNLRRDSRGQLPILTPPNSSWIPEAPRSTWTLDGGFCGPKSVETQNS